MSWRIKAILRFFSPMEDTRVYPTKEPLVYSKFYHGEIFQCLIGFGFVVLIHHFAWAGLTFLLMHSQCVPNDKHIEINLKGKK